MISNWYYYWLVSLQISTCTRAHLQTSWEKTQHSHAPSALRLTSTTYEQTSQKTTGSMVHPCWLISTLTCQMHSKVVIAFSRNFQPLFRYKELLCALRIVTGIPEGGKQSTHSFSCNFLYECQSSTRTTPTGEFTVCHKVHSLSHTTTSIHLRLKMCTVITEEGALPASISSLERFTTTDGLSFINSCLQGLSPCTWAPHFATTRSETFGVMMSVPVSVFLSVCKHCPLAGQAEKREGAQHLFFCVPLEHLSCAAWLTMI